MQLTGFATGTRIPFENNTAPVGWTAVTDSAHNGAALRIVNAAVSGAQTGGSSEFNSVFNSGVTVSITGQLTESATLTGLTSATILTEAQIPAHSHSMKNEQFNIGGVPSGTALNRPADVGGVPTSATDTGGNQVHTHSLEDKGAHSHVVSVAQDNAFNLDVKYINFIVCEKD